MALRRDSERRNGAIEAGSTILDPPPASSLQACENGAEKEDKLTCTGTGSTLTHTYTATKVEIVSVK